MQRRTAAILATVAATAAVKSWEGVFSTAIMATGSYVAFPIPRFVCVEVVESRLTAPRQRSVVAVMRVKAVVHMAVKARMAVKPRTSANKQPTDKPVGPIVAVWGAVIWGIVEVPVGANGSHSNVDGDLGRPKRCTA